MDDASPTKWHRAHTSWFFETFLLEAFGGGRVSPESYRVMFNSYYNGVGEQHARPQRGLLTRPSSSEIAAYRAAVDDAVEELLLNAPSHQREELTALTTLGLHHEQQHQELLLTDIKHLLAQSPLNPIYRPAQLEPIYEPPELWLQHPGGVVDIGHAADSPSFHFDNEGPRHQVLLQPFALRNDLVTNAEYLAFVEDGAYTRPELWLAAGWDAVQQQGWRGPLYWEQANRAWTTFTLYGRQPLDPHAPVTHVSYFEAEAFARWAGYRLPTEFEWEARAPTPEKVAVGTHPPADWAPEPRPRGHASDFYGACWQWTSSAYAPYPRYAAPEGAVGEYNGKFMCGQQVLRGSSCATSPGHARLTYRNFFPAPARWQFTGIRLAQDLPG